MSLCGRQKVVERKMVLLGDGACGKTSALNVFTRGFPHTMFERDQELTLDEQPGSFPQSKVGILTFISGFAVSPQSLKIMSMVRRSADSESELTFVPCSPAADIFVDNVHMELSLWDTAGQEEFDRLRALSYEDTHVLMLCFSVDSPDSFENVGSKWIAEINENCPGVKLVLTALKCDLRKDEDMNDNPNAITFEQGLAKAKEIGAVKYLECSAVQNRGIRESFYEAAKVALEVKPVGGKNSNSSCVIL
ncbi:GTP-binding protein RHO3 [Penicillium diatomitis]|uniref:GTP-binding protein RHO3 n=1 Tax=Penicillium diatomitis TaxID=2819901 RepID=A0A9W9WU09_9EURO|nr:GTP-binding protein RHO3 [Penicillium diatomitis]KAJ5475459.1 GTP-binding protein RHO3 [Penicillium diatomitis]